MSARERHSEQVYARLFGQRDLDTPEKDPEFMRILRTLIFGDVFSTGDLDDQTRELITVTVLATLQTLPQLKVHANAALTVGVDPVALREAIYQLAPLIGFPRTLNALGILNEVLTDRGHELPLPAQATISSDEHRKAVGGSIQGPLYGTEIADEFAEGLAASLPTFLTEFLFGDLYSRTGLDLAQRELLVFVSLAALGLDRQLGAHVGGALRAGNSPSTLLAALIQAFPYMGFPAAINAARVVLKHQQATQNNPAPQPESNVFPLGQPSETFAQYFTGQSFLAPLLNDSDTEMTVAHVTFEPGCRNSWHVHQDGYQLLLVTSGQGWLQEEGNPARKLVAGDVAIIHAGVKHWHGASSTSWFSHIAVTTGATEWFEKVDATHYLALNEA